MVIRRILLALANIVGMILHPSSSRQPTVPLFTLKLILIRALDQDLNWNTKPSVVSLLNYAQDCVYVKDNEILLTKQF